MGGVFCCISSGFEIRIKNILNIENGFYLESMIILYKNYNFDEKILILF